VEDRDIIELYWQRDETALSETAAKYSNYCRKIIGNILFIEEDIEECLNDTWLRTWNLIPPYKPSELKIFVGRIARGFAINRCKSNTARKRSTGQYDFALEELEETLEGKDTAEGEADLKILAAAISDFLKTQPTFHTNIFIRRYFSMDKISDIAKAFEISESRVKSILFRMRKKLKRYLEKEEII